MRRFKIEDLEAHSQPIDPNDGSWLAAAEQSVEFLKTNAKNDEIVIYASAKGVLVHGVLGLTRKLNPDSIAQLSYRNPPMADDSWKIQQVWGGGKEHRMYLEAPLASVSDALIGGDKLIFRRRFDGVARGPTAIEASQKLVHSLELHFVPERSAYCRLDARGDIEDVIRILRKEGSTEWDSLEAVVIQRTELDKFMALSKQSLVVRFDFTRVRWSGFAGWSNINHYKKQESDIQYHGGVTSQGSFCNGVVVVRPQVTVAALIRQWKASQDPKQKKYATFKIYDRKNQTNAETSCAPEFLSNYFQDSNLPWEISPAFFRAEVLHRFKADPEKYSLEDRSISCRNAWYLKTFDINDAGQVHTYIGYLADLPHEEQLYWQAFNEWPKASISKRAFQTDIVGSWDLEYEPLNSIKHAIGKLDDDSPTWWKRRGQELTDAVRNPATDSVKEWADEILALDQLLVEGFLVKPLTEMAEKGGRSIEKRWASLRVLQEVLVVCGHEESAAKALVEPFQRLHALRTEVRGHAALEKKRAAEVKARKEFGALRNHFSHLVAECDAALKVVRSSLSGKVDD